MSEHQKEQTPDTSPLRGHSTFENSTCACAFASLLFAETFTGAKGQNDRSRQRVGKEKQEEDEEGGHRRRPEQQPTPCPLQASDPKSTRRNSDQEPEDPSAESAETHGFVDRAPRWRSSPDPATKTPATSAWVSCSMSSRKKTMRRI
nr:uncharacterized protein LOC109024718 [Gorilla gorilla gorilla]